MNYTRRTFIQNAGLGIVAMVASSCSYPKFKTQKRPNFIVIFTDDQGYQDLGSFGSPNIKTPNIDRMAKEGMRFTDFYSAAPICTPSRAGLLTGCYPERVGGLNVLFPNQKIGLNPEETTIADMLKGTGYATGCVGKWHLGHKKEFLPTSQGFDSYYGIPYSNDMWIDPNMKLAPNIILREGMTIENIEEQRDPKKRKNNFVPLMRNDEVIEYPADQNTLTRRYTEEAVKFITKNRKQSFFLYLAHTMPHIPLYASAGYEGKSDAGLYGDAVEEIDWSVGQILDVVKKIGIDENTLIIYTSDNGPWNLPGNKTDKVKGNMNRRIGGSAIPLRGYKFDTWEGSMRVPTVMWGPGHISAGRECHELAGTIDLLPTIAELSGAKLPEKKIDGKSITALMEGRKGAKGPHNAYFYGTEAVRCGKWKLKNNELFDLSKDISESNNIAQDNPELVSKLKKVLADHVSELEKSKRLPGRINP